MEVWFVHLPLVLCLVLVQRYTIRYQISATKLVAYFQKALLSETMTSTRLMVFATIYGRTNQVFFYNVSNVFKQQVNVC